MQLVIDKMLSDFERGHITRRQLALSLAALVTGAQAAAKETELKAVTINHVTVRVPDLHRTSQFYQEFFGMPLKQQSATIHILGVGESSFFGIEQDQSKTAAVSHYDFGMANFNADEVRAKLTDRGLKFDGNSKESFKFYDPDGFHVQVNAPDYVGHVS